MTTTTCGPARHLIPFLGFADLAGVVHRQATRHAGTWHAGTLLAGGLVGLAAYNVWRWRDDLALATRLRTEHALPPPPLSTTPKVSILVAAWNEARGVERHIESVRCLRYPHKEYILCAGGPDGTFDLARRYATQGVTILEQQPGEGKQRALERAYRQSTGDIIYLTDADCLLDDVSFERALAPITNEGEAVTTGSSIPPAEQRRHSDFAVYQWAVQQYSLARLPAYTAGLLGRNAAVRRDALEAAGTFQADVPSGTDYHLAKALLGSGYRIRGVPASLVVTPYATTWARYARQQRRWLRNVAFLGARSGAWNEVRASLQTSLLGAAMLLGFTTIFWSNNRSRRTGGAGVAGSSSPSGAPPSIRSFASRLAFILWCLGLVQSSMAKLRYLAFGRVLGGQAPIRLVHPATAMQYTIGEFAVWTLPLLDYPFAGRRQRW